MSACDDQNKQPYGIQKDEIKQESTNMGICLPCLEGQADDYEQPDQDTRRKQAAEAAEKRKHDEESRGVKDPEGLKRKQQKREEMEKKGDQVGGEGGLKWQVG